MNKIYISDDLIKKTLTHNIKIEENNGFINSIIIDFNSDCELEITMNCEMKKYNIIYNINNCKVKITEIKEGKIKVMNCYNLEENSYLKLIKINDVAEIRQNDIINLLKENASVEYVLKTCATKTEKYNVEVKHNAKNTNSLIINHGINITGNIDFNVSTTVLSGMKHCVANQNSRIINLVNKKCNIRPNLFIDEFEVEADHAALIGNFLDSEIFYLQRLGINESEAKKLLMEGFLKSYIDYDIEIFKKHWR